MDHELRWRKSSFSGGDNGECVELGRDSDGPIVAARDSKNPDVILAVTSAALASMLRSLGR